MINNIYDQLKRDEGFRSTIYKDEVGKSTVGYGHNLDAKPLPDLVTPITEEQAEQILSDDVDVVTNKLAHLLPWSDSLDGVRFGVLQNMAFNMGIEGLLEFHNTLTCVQQKKYVAAANCMMQSKWYTEVGDRAKRLVTQMITRVWQ